MVDQTCYLDDVVASLVPHTKFEPSEIIHINGQDASKYVEDFSRLAAPLQGPDAAYNAMFFEKAFPAAAIGSGLGYFSGGGRFRYIYPGANTTIEFANGTRTTYQNIAFVKGDFSGVTDGASLFRRFCPFAFPALTSPTPILTPTPTPTPSKRSEPRAANTVTGYPTSNIISSDNVVSGYYLPDGPLDDVAVLVALDFLPNSPLEFQTVVQNFIADAKRDGKTKIVIDLSANGGGYILNGYDMYRQFFPQIEQDGFSHIRENPAMLTIAKIISDSVSPYFNPANASDTAISDYVEFFNYRYDLNMSDRHFSSFEDKFAPHVNKGDPYTSILGWDLNDPLTTTNDTYGIGMEITGYGTRRNFTQPFAAKDIILVGIS